MYPEQQKVRVAAAEAAEAAGINLADLPLSVTAIIEAVGELEHSCMEPGAYTVNMEQYAEVAADIVRILINVLGPEQRP